MRSTYAVFTALLVLTLACATREAPHERTIHLDQAEETDRNEAGGGDNLVVGEDACETDADCVPAACCHAAACVAAANAPSCEDAMCTMDCQFGTLDCGGRCLCHEGRCAARLSEMPRPQVNGEPVEGPERSPADPNRS